MASKAPVATHIWERYTACPLGCQLLKTSNTEMEIAIRGIKHHIRHNHANLIEAELHDIVLEERCKLVYFPQLILETHGARPFTSLRLECPLGCPSFRKTLTDLGRPIDEMADNLGGLSPSQLKAHLENRHPAFQDANLTPEALAFKYQPSIPAEFRRGAYRVAAADAAHDEDDDAMDLDPLVDLPAFAMPPASAFLPGGSHFKPIDRAAPSRTLLPTPALVSAFAPGGSRFTPINASRPAAEHGWDRLNILADVAVQTLGDLSAAPAVTVGNPSAQQTPSPQRQNPSPQSQASASSSPQPSTQSSLQRAGGPVYRPRAQPQEDREDPTRTVLCDQCDWRFHTEADLGKHVNKHHHDDTFDCDECDKSYKLRATLYVHKKKKHPKDDDSKEGKGKK